MNATSFCIGNKLRCESDFLETELEFYGKQTGVLYPAFLTVIQNLPYYIKGKTFRKNGIMAVLLRFSYQSDTLNGRAWVKDVSAWIHLNFITDWGCLLALESGYDTDQSGHVNALLIPATPEGKISFDYSFGGRSKCCSLQTSYHQLMRQKYSLSRFPAGSEKLSSASHIILGGTVLNQLPDPYPGETADDYRKRVEPIFASMSVSLAGKTETQKESSQALLWSRVEEYLSFISRYGSVKRAEQMLRSAQEIQYGIRFCQEQGRADMVQMTHQTILAGRNYMKEHGIF